MQDLKSVKIQETAGDLSDPPVVRADA